MNIKIANIGNDIDDSMRELHGIAALIESMGSSDALEMDNNERQAALYLLSDTTRAIIEKVEASVNELHIINKAEDIDSVGEYDATEAERLENLLVPAE